MSWLFTIRKFKLDHLLFWLLVFAFWFYLRYQDYPTIAMAVAVTAVKVADLILLVYLVNRILIPKLMYKGRYLACVGWFFLALLLSGVLKALALEQITETGAASFTLAHLKTRLYENVISDFFLVTSGAAFQLLFDYLAIQRRVAVIAREKAETELAFLKSQINPHFLFNSLNAVYFLIHRDNKEAREALYKFSEMLRYQLYETGGAPIPVEKEVAYLRDYVAMQRLRKDSRYTVALESGEGLAGFSIEPLLLIPFVENAFKHLSHRPDRENFVRINIGKELNQLIFQVANSFDVSISPDEGGGGIGLANVKRRLELLYPGKHRLDINMESGIYSVHLELAVDG